MSEHLLRYVTTRADQVAKLQLYAAQTQTARWFPPITYALIVGLSWFSAWLFYVRQGDRNHFYIAAGALALFLTVALPFLYRRYQDSFLSSLLTDDKLQGLIGPVELSVDQERIEERRGPSTISARWADVEEIEGGRDHIIVRLAPLIAILIPHRAFDSVEARDRFAISIRSRLN